MTWYCWSSNKDKEPMEPKQPSLKKKIGGCIGSPNFCCGCALPCFSKPEEYFTTWILNDYIITWPWHPREGEAVITSTDRVVVAFMIITTDVVIFLLCSYGIGKFYTAATGEEAGVIGSADSSLVVTNPAHIWVQCFVVFNRPILFAGCCFKWKRSCGQQYDKC
jgi:hypothetical protein